MWCRTFSSCIFSIDWETFITIFEPLILKMASMSQASGKRTAAGQIIISATNFSIANNLSSDAIMQDYLELFQDVDTTIRTNALNNLNYLLGFLDQSFILEQLCPEVIYILELANHLSS